MNILVILSFLSTAVSLIIGLYVLFKDIKNPINRNFFYFLFCIVLWSGMEYIYKSNNGPLDNPLIQNIGAIGYIFMGPLFLQFILYFCDRADIIKRKIWLLIYLPAVILLIMHWYTDFIFTHKLFETKWGYYRFLPGKLVTVYMVYYLSCFIAGLYHLIIQYKKAIKKERKKQILIILTFVSFALILGTITDVILPAAGSMHLPDIAANFGLIFSIGIAIAIAKYQLMITSELTTENILSLIPDAFILIDAEGKIVKTNRSIENLLNYKESELIGKKFFSIIKYNKMLKEAVKDYNVQCCLKNNKRLNIRLTTSLIKNKSGKVLGVTGILRDTSRNDQIITELRKTKEELENKIKELENFHDVAVEREFDMLELKDEIKYLKRKLNKKNV